MGVEGRARKYVACSSNLHEQAVGVIEIDVDDEIGELGQLLDVNESEDDE